MSGCRVIDQARVMPYCQNCGTPVAQDAKYCPACGTKLERRITEEFSIAANELIKRVEELIHEGNVTRIIVKDEGGKTLLEIPATVGIVGAILAPWLAALGVIAALVTRCRIVVERRVE
ncbi:MAG: DUF4342 domain-containing protein [Candidatus Methanomethyliaceae archaeon]|nr:DUF4342 domain-containing protein [Candidatus Verstraetearchaeota archaeon]